MNASWANYKLIKKYTANYRNGKQIKGCQRLEMREGDDYKGQHGGIWGMLGLFCVLIVVVVTELQASV